MFKLVCIHPCVHRLYLFYIIVYNNMEQKEKGLFIGGENMVNVRPFDCSYIVFLFHNDCTK